jgi:tetratricopeptide (TPR) repeat protein
MIAGVVFLANIIVILCLQGQPAVAEARLKAGIDYFRAGKLDEARAELEQAVRLAPSNALAWKSLGAVHAAQGRYQAAEEPLRKACALDPKEPDACYYLGRNCYQLSRFETAIAAYEKALTTHIKTWRVHNGMALALEALGRAGEAERHFRSAAELNAAAGNTARPDENPRIDLGAFLYRAGRTAESVEQLEKAVTEYGNSARARFELGKALFQSNRLDSAARHLEVALKIEPAHVPAHLLLGKIYYRLGRVQDAEREMRLGRQ